MKNRIFSAVLAVTLLSTFLSGCGNPSTPESSSSLPESPEPDTSVSEDSDTNLSSKPEPEDIFADYHRFSPDALNKRGTALLSPQAYRQLLSDFSRQITEFHWNKMDNPTETIFILRENFPFLPLISDADYRPEHDTVSLEYRYDIAEHQEKMRALADGIEQIMQTISLDTDNKIGIALSLYRYLAATTDLSEENGGIYPVIIEQTGDALSLAEAYCYLLRQFSIDAQTILDEQNQPLVAVELDSRYYIMDLAAELLDTRGNGLQFFAALPTEQVKVNHSLPFAEEDRFAILHDDLLAWVFGEDGNAVDLFFSSQEEAVAFLLE